MTDNAIQNIQTIAMMKVGFAVKETNSYRKSSMSTEILHASSLIRGPKRQDHQDSIQTTLFSKSTGRMRQTFFGTLQLAERVPSVS